MKLKNARLWLMVHAIISITLALLGILMSNIGIDFLATLAIVFSSLSCVLALIAFGSLREYGD